MQKSMYTCVHPADLTNCVGTDNSNILTVGTDVIYSVNGSKVTVNKPRL